MSSANAWSRIPWPVFAGLCFALPLAGAGLTRQFVLHGGPRVALAKSDEMLPLMPVKDEQAGTAATKARVFDEQLAAAYAQRGSDAIVRSPIAERRTNQRNVVEQAMPVGSVEPVLAQRASLPAGVTVTSMLAAPTGNRAVIAGKLRGVGDEVVPTWRIAAIDPDAGEVTCVHESGERVVLRIKRPGRQQDERSDDLMPGPR
jgi:hypothetical protein